jgi:hypothetical protein
VEFSNEIFEKALNQPLFASMQAELCRRLHTHYDPSDAKYTDNIGKQLTFRRVLLKNCQNEFVRFEHLAKEGAEIEATVARQGDGADNSEEAKRIKTEVGFKAVYANKRMLGMYDLSESFTGGTYYQKPSFIDNVDTRCQRSLLRRRRTLLKLCVPLSRGQVKSCQRVRLLRRRN